MWSSHLVVVDPVEPAVALERRKPLQLCTGDGREEIVILPAPPDRAGWQR